MRIEARFRLGRGRTGPRLLRRDVHPCPTAASPRSRRWQAAASPTPTRTSTSGYLVPRFELGPSGIEDDYFSATGFGVGTETSR